MAGAAIEPWKANWREPGVESREEFSWTDENTENIGANCLTWR